LSLSAVCRSAVIRDNFRGFEFANGPRDSSVARLQDHRDLVLSTLPEVELDNFRFGGDCHESCLSEIAREIYNVVNHREKVSSRLSCFSFCSMAQRDCAKLTTYLAGHRYFQSWPINSQKDNVSRPSKSQSEPGNRRFLGTVRNSRHMLRDGDREAPSIYKSSFPLCLIHRWLQGRFAGFCKSSFGLIGPL
jgi:hypothetical protein